MMECGSKFDWKLESGSEVELLPKRFKGV